MNEPNSAEQPVEEVDLNEFQQILNQLRLQLDQTVEPQDQDSAAVDELLGIDDPPADQPQSLW